MITFLCPNGHKLSAPDQQGGRAGQCPDCGARFRIPPGESAPEPPHGGVATTDPSHLDHAPDQIVFLCPKGHRLHGPPSLAGKAGQCPQCGAKFRIPPLVEEDTAAEASVAVTVATPVEQASEEEIPLEEIEEIADESAERSEAHAPATSMDEVDLDFAALERLVESSHGEISDDRFTDRDESHPMATLLEQLWGTQGSDAVIEIRLESGETLVPHFYAATRSRRSHAFLAIREPHGKHALIVVPWASVSRITIRGLTELPEEFA